LQNVSDPAAPASVGTCAPAVLARGVVKTFALKREHPTAFGAFRQALLQKRQQFVALDGVDLEIVRGERVGLIGNNGAGKSTLLKVLAGLHRPTAGQVHVEGSITLLSALGIGMLDELSVLDNIHLYGAIYGIPRAALQTQISEMLEWAELQEFRHARLKHLSTGMRARLAFSVLRHVDNDVYLLDEVMTAGDKNFRARCLEVFEGYQRRGKTVVLATHERSFAEGFCSKVLWLERGRVRQFGDTAEVLHAYYDSTARGA
jgi:ABC-type polysaccharide/polyol phosphate transport system ATPase subunit